MRREGMLYRYLRDYTPNSPVNSPLDSIPYDLDPDEETVDTQLWWNDQQNTNPRSRRNSSVSIDPMDLFLQSTRVPSVSPISIPEPSCCRPNSTPPNNDQMHVSPTNTTASMPPPMVPQLARMKRKGMRFSKNVD
jgi:hypothetical protein